MNAPTKTTRLFYTWRTPDDIVLPACLETTGTWEEAEAELARQMICQNAPVASVIMPFTSRRQVEARIADYERRIENLPGIELLEPVRRAFVNVVASLRRELGEG